MKQGLSISALCDRNAAGDVWSSQLGFIDFIIKPLFTTWCHFLGSEKVSNDCLLNIATNRETWETKKRENGSQQAYRDEQLLAVNFFEIKHAATIRKPSAIREIQAI